jgi:hypothetical protein
MSMLSSAVQRESFSMYAAKISGSTLDFHVALGKEKANFSVDLGRRVELVGGVMSVSQQEDPREQWVNYRSACTLFDLNARQVLLHIKTYRSDTLEKARGIMFKRENNGRQQFHTFLLRNGQLQDYPRHKFPPEFKNFMIICRPRELSQAVTYPTPTADPIHYTGYLSDEVKALVEQRDRFMGGMDWQLSIALSCSLDTGRIESAWFTDCMQEAQTRQLNSFPFRFDGLLPGERIPEWVIHATGTYSREGRMR